MESVHWSVGFTLFYSSSCIIIKFGFLELFPSPVRDWPLQLLLPPEPSCGHPCSSSVSGRGLRIQLLGWVEKSPLPQWCVCVAVQLFFPFAWICFLYICIMWAWKPLKIQRQVTGAGWIVTAVNTGWSSVCGHLPMSRWPKGVCMERTPIFVGDLNVVVTLFIQSS